MQYQIYESIHFIKYILFEKIFSDNHKFLYPLWHRTHNIYNIGNVTCCNAICIFNSNCCPTFQSYFRWISI